VLAKKFPQWAQLSAEDRRDIRFIKVVPPVEFPKE